MRMYSLVCVVAVFVTAGCESYETQKSKEEYAILQGLEFEHRGTPVSNVEIISRNGYTAAGFRAEGRDQNVWVMLNPRYPPRFKQVPDVAFKVTAEDLATVRRQQNLSKDVLAVLDARSSR
jgi:hypothetical protein